MLLKIQYFAPYTLRDFWGEKLLTFPRMVTEYFSALKPWPFVFQDHKMVLKHLFLLGKNWSNLKKFFYQMINNKWEMYKKVTFSQYSTNILLHSKYLDSVLFNLLI